MNNRNVPVDFDTLDTQGELSKVFRGMAIYNGGRITLAFRAPMIMRQITIGSARLMTAGFAVDADTRIALDFEPMQEKPLTLDEVRAMFDTRRPRPHPRKR